MKMILKFFEYFPYNKKAFIKYSFLSLIAGVLELMGVALTYPFVIKLLNKEPSAHTYLPAIIGIFIILLFISKNIFMIFYVYLQANYVKSFESEIQLKFMNYFLTTSYEESSKISYAKKTNILGFMTSNIINNYILRLLNLNVNLFIFGLISCFLVIKFTLATCVTIITAFFLIYVQNAFYKPKLKKISTGFNESSIIYNQKANETLSNIKGVKISNNEKQFFDNFKKALLDFNNNSKKTFFLQAIPPYITEPFIIILLFILLAIISAQNYTNPQKLVASFALIVSAIFRLAPTISRIQINLNGIHSVTPILKDFLNIAEKFNLKNLAALSEKDFTKFEDSIELAGISYEYKQNKPVLSDINLKINKGDFIGIAGLSGSGKTTLTDIIAGLLKPKTGQIFADGKILSKPVKIGYIPQEFNTISASIRENVAFGYNEIDDERVITALKQAQLYDFIQNNFKDGIYANPFVDSTGFSQGQKQRIAIARALYSNPDILILDEATSSLDLKTEDEISHVLTALRGEKTIIAIAHRLSTIKSADKIVFMQNGAIQNIAPFEQLIDINANFRELVRLGSLS